MSQENYTEEESSQQQQELCARDGSHNPEKGHSYMGEIRGMFTGLETKLHIFQGSRERSLALTNLEQAFMWAERCFTLAEKIYGQIATIWIIANDDVSFPKEGLYDTVGYLRPDRSGYTQYPRGAEMFNSRKLAEEAIKKSTFTNCVVIPFDNVTGMPGNLPENF